MLNAKFYPLFQATFRAVEALLAQWQVDELHIRLLQAPLSTLKNNFMTDKIFPALLGPLLAYQSLRKPDTQFTHLAAAHVLFYAFLDLTDDVEDHDLRAGIWRYLDESLAINAGTSLLFLSLLALDALQAHQVSPETILQLRQQFSQAGWYLTIGQHQDLYSRSQTQLSPEACLETIRLKSGTSVGLYFSSAACLAGASSGVQQHFQALGEALGSLMQLRSDYTNIMDHEISSDLKNRQFTLPLALAYPQLSPADQESFDVALSRCQSDRAAHTLLRHLLKKSNCRLQINDYVEKYQTIIAQHLENLAKENCQITDLSTFASRLTPV